MDLQIHTIEVGDELTMIGPDGLRSHPFTLAEMPALRSGAVWLYREYDMPIVVERTYGLEATFVLHSRHGQPSDETGGRHRA